MERKGKLLVINGNGPIEGDVQTLLILLKGLENGPFEIFVLTKPRGDTYEKLKQMSHLNLFPLEMGGNEAVPPHNTRTTQMRDFSNALLKITAFVHQHHISALYTIDRGVAPQLAALASKFTGCPFILCAAYPFYGRDSFRGRFVLNQATRIQIHSRYLRSYLAPYVRHTDRFVLHHYGLEIEKYNPALNGLPTRNLYHIPANAPLIVMAGRLSPYKGQDDLIKAAAVVSARYPQARFLISGRGPDPIKQELETLITDLNIGNQVQLVGYVPSVPAFMAAADIVAMPSWEEPFGLVALEGMAMSKPIISTAAGGVPEFVTHEKVGLLIPPRDPQKLAQAIIELIANPEKAKTMGQQGRQHVQQYHTAQRYVQNVTATIAATMKLS